MYFTAARIPGQCKECSALASGGEKGNIYGLCPMCYKDKLDAMDKDENLEPRFDWND